MYSTDDKEHPRQYKHHEPDLKNFFPVYLHREFVLENGRTTLLGTTNLTSVHAGDIVVCFEHDEMKESRIVSKLHGKEKNPALRAPMIEE